MNNNIRHRVHVCKHSFRTYAVWEYTFDKDGNTVNLKRHGYGLSYKDAHALKREILECYE